MEFAKTPQMQFYFFPQYHTEYVDSQGIILLEWSTTTL